MTYSCSQCGRVYTSVVKFCASCGNSIPLQSIFTNVNSESISSSATPLPQDSQVIKPTASPIKPLNQAPIAASINSPSSSPLGPSLTTPDFVDAPKIKNSDNDSHYLDHTNKSAKKSISKYIWIFGFISIIIAIMMVLTKSNEDIRKGVSPAPEVEIVQSSQSAQLIQPAKSSQQVSPKEILNEILGLVREDKWQDINQRVKSLKDLTNITNGNRAVSENLVQDGINFLETDHTSEAISSFEKAISEDASFSLPRSLLGRTLTRAGKIDIARNVLIDALVIEPDRGSTWLSAAEMFAEMNKPDESALALKLAIYFSSNREIALQSLQDRTKFQSPSFWKVIEANRPSFSGVPLNTLNK